MTNNAKWWRADIFAKKMPYLKQRALILSEIRKFFTERDFLEPETAILQISPGLEPHLKAFQTQMVEPFEDQMKTMYLHTSPEFAMKKLLAAGLPRIFQMARVFRNEQRSTHHHPEFVMLEWYRAHADYTALMDDTQALVQACAKACGVETLAANGMECAVFGDWERISIRDAFKKYADMDIFDYLPATASLDPDPTEFAKAAQRIGIETNPTDSWDDIYFRVMFEKIETQIGKTRPTILYDYPVCMAALSRRKPSDERLAERFEVYACGVELGNAFSELTDVKEQRARFEHDMDLKEKLYGERYPVDEDFMDALAYMPDAAGIAIGVDRLVMLITHAKRIEDVIWTPVA